MWSLPWPTLNLSPQDFSITNICSTASLCVGQSMHENFGVFLAATEVADTPKAPNKQNPEGGEVVDGAEPSSLEPHRNPLTKSLLFPSQPQHSGCESLLLRRSRHLEQPVCFLHPPSAFTQELKYLSMYVFLPFCLFFSPPWLLTSIIFVVLHTQFSWLRAEY